MPKTKVPPLPPDDVPIWDALIAELGDPRPYDVADLGPTPRLDVTDEPCVDDAGLDDALSDLDDAVESAVVVLESLEVEGRHDAQVVVDEFRERHRIVPPPDLALRELLDQTVVLPALTGERTAQLNREQLRWPS